MKPRRDPFQAIVDPTRRAILVLLASQTMTAGAIATNFKSARPTISKHIRVLSECHLIEPKYRGREIYYEIKPDKLSEIDRWLEQFKQVWEERFEQLDNILLTLQKKER